MNFRDLQEFATLLESKGLLKRVSVPVSPELEIAEIADRVCKKGGPALLFEKVEGSDYPVLVNVFGSLERVKLALGTEELDVVGQRLREMAEPPDLRGTMDKIRALPRLLEKGSYYPKIIRNAPCQQVIEAEPDLRSLPVLKCWPKDAGRFITLPLVITVDPDTGRRNVGMYRMQVYDATTAGLHWHPHKDGAHHFEKYKSRGRRMEVAVALGGDPATIYAATAPLPRGMDELFFAGFIRRAPVELVRCKTVNLEVPAHAEFVLEGYVDPEEKRLEGPFGDHTGFYSPAEDFPVFHLQCITRKAKPIYPATVVGRPPMEDYYLGKATERIFLPLLQLQLPEIVDMDFPAEGVFHNCVVVSINKAYPGHARKVMHALWGLGQMSFTKLIVVVDAHVNVHDPSEVWWRVFCNVDARRDVVMVEGPVDALDHASPTPLLGWKMGIDATVKGPDEGHPRQWPEEICMDRETIELVNRKWKDYGLE